MISERTIEAVKMIPCTKFLTKSKGNNMYCCPFCNSGNGKNHTGALKYYASTNTFYCHGCGKGGDVIKLYMQTQGVDFNEAVEQIAESEGIAIEYDRTEPRADSKTSTLSAEPQAEGREPIKEVSEPTTGGGNLPLSDAEPPKDYTAYYEQCRGRITDPRAAEYLKSRGISLETAKRYWIGFDPQADPAESGIRTPRIIVPANCHHYIARSIDPNTPKDYRVMNPKGSTPGIFNQAALYTDTGAVFVTEGSFDALAILEAGYTAVALNSTSNKEKFIETLKAKKTAATLILCLDSDAKGQEATEYLKTELPKLNQGFILGDICGSYKDPNEHLTGDKNGFIMTLKDAISKAANSENIISEMTPQGEPIKEDDGTTSTLSANAEPQGVAIYSISSHEQDFIDAIIESKNNPPIPTGFKQIDDALDGGFTPGLHIMGGMTGTGKTTFLLQVACQMAESGRDCLYISLEMAMDELIARCISRHTLLNILKEKKDPSEALSERDVTAGYRQNKEHGFTDEKKELLKKSMDDYFSYAREHMYIMEATMKDVGIAEIEKVMETFKADGKKPIVFLDYLQLIGAYDPRYTDKMNMDANVKKLRILGLKYKTPIIAISSFNRAAYKKGFSYESFKESGAIEYTNDTLFGLQYTAVEKDDFDEKKEAHKKPRELQIKIIKSRHSEPWQTVDIKYYSKSNYMQESNKANRKREY